MTEISGKRGQKKQSRSFEQSRFDKELLIGKQLREPVVMETPLCKRCGKPIKDITSALADKADGEPVHFDCVLEFLKKSEPLQEGESISYIGQGWFAVIKYVSMVTMKEFSIVRIIEWEDKNHRAEWRSKIAQSFSQID